MTRREFIDLPQFLGASGTLVLPGSKSISNRALLLAALAAGVWALNVRGEQAMVQTAPPPGPASMEQIQRGEYLARAGNCISCHFYERFSEGYWLPQEFLFSAWLPQLSFRLP